jgi:hypothetical protein
MSVSGAVVGQDSPPSQRVRPNGSAGEPSEAKAAVQTQKKWELEREKEAAGLVLSLRYWARWSRTTEMQDVLTKAAIFIEKRK